MKVLHRIGVWLSLLLIAGCAGGGHPPGQLLPLPQIGMNLGIGDLINRPDAGQRVAIYLDEIAAAGYAHEVRMVFDRSWGPQLMETVIPVMRANKGFKLLAVLTPGNQAGPVNTPADLAWIQHALPLMADVLVGVQLSNEPWQSKIDNNKLTPFPPGEYVRWHNALTPTIRALAPGVPIVDSDIDGGWDSAKRWWEAVQQVPISPDMMAYTQSGTIDIDALSWHVYTSEIPKTYGRTVWITEAGDTRDCVAPAVKCFVYVWAGVGSDARFAKRPGGGILK